MATIKEDYVSFEIAKLLKEKGFNEQCLMGCSFTNHEPIPFTPYCINSGIGEQVYSVPTLQMAMKWLREVHDLHIEVLPWCADEKEKEENKKRWLCKVYKLYGMYGCDIYTNETPKSYEEACEAAIKYCLENLI